uniref:PpiC domain-containing protein n=1 Tax=Desulfobacca acetoxidans TaxID=60893 RepID=A0A7C5AKN9_9BACT
MKFVKSICCWLLFLVSLWLSASPHYGAAEVVDRIVAVVNDEVITQSEVDQLAQALHTTPGVRLPAGSGQELQRQLLDSLILQKLAKAEAKRRGITLSDKEVHQAFEDFKKRNHITDEKALAESLAKSGMTIAQLKQQIVDQMTHERLLMVVAGTKVTVTEADVRRFYEQEYPKAGGTQFHLRMLNLPYPSGATEAQRQEVKKKAELILEEYRKGVSWEELRQKHALLIQDLGYVALMDLDPKLASLLANAKPGDTVPVETLQGFQLVQLVNRREGRGKSYEEAAPEIRNFLQRREMEKHFHEWLKSQRDRAHIQILM